jgi:flagellar protein FliO/FliZ
MAGGLFLVLALLFLVLFLLKRYGHKVGLTRQFPSGLKILGQISLGPRKSIFVVQYLNKVMVLGVTDSSITLLTETAHADHDRNSFAAFATHLDQPQKKDPG